MYNAWGYNNISRNIKHIKTQTWYRIDHKEWEWSYNSQINYLTKKKQLIAWNILCTVFFCSYRFCINFNFWNKFISLVIRKAFRTVDSELSFFMFTTVYFWTFWWQISETTDIQGSTKFDTMRRPKTLKIWRFQRQIKFTALNK